MGTREDKTVDKMIRELTGQLSDSIHEWKVDVRDSILDDYIETDDFQEEACAYCRRVGWKEPE